MTDDALRKECEQLAKQLWHSEACEPLQLVDAILRFARKQQARGVRRVQTRYANRHPFSHPLLDAVVEYCDSTARELEKL